MGKEEARKAEPLRDHASTTYAKELAFSFSLWSLKSLSNSQLVRLRAEANRILDARWEDLKKARESGIRPS
jgi:hypothetical protein